jgi:signal transduction histidine kinase
MTDLLSHPLTLVPGRGSDTRSWWSRTPAWARILLCWAGVATFFVLQSVTGSLSRGQPVDPLLQIGNEYLYWSVWALLTPAMLLVIRRHPFETDRRRDLVVHLLTMIGFGVLQVIGADLLEYALVSLVRAPGAEVLDRWRQGLLRGAPGLWFTFAYKYWAVVGIVLAVRYRRRWEDRELATARLETRLAEARLESLRAQLQPHFLFNALHTVGMLSLTQPPEATRVVSRLSELLRRTIDLPADHFSRLAEELDFVDRYLEIERARFGERLRVELTAPDEVLEARVPSLVLQPLVENAVRHGIGPNPRGGTIRIVARTEPGAAGDRLILEVADDGNGMSVDPTTTTGVGLRNLRERLARLYGDQARLELPSPGSPAVMRIRLPLVRS